MGKLFKFFFCLLFILFSNTIFAKQIMPVLLTIQDFPLTKKEKTFIKNVNPYGFIFIEYHFKKKYDTKLLKEQLTQLLGRDVPFFIDQEGGSVNRLKHLYPDEYFPPASELGKLAEKDLFLAVGKTYNLGFHIGNILSDIAFDVNLAPNAEVNPIDTKGFFKSRAYSDNPKIVHILSNAFALGLKDGGIEPCFKHFPGTGQSQVDPHKAFAVIEDLTLYDLEQRDLIPFEHANNYKYIMVGHAYYPEIDKENLSTYSPKIYQILRDDYNFEGFILTDALNMNASGKRFTLGTKMRLALEAGADIALPFFPHDMSFAKQQKELNKIPKYIINNFNKKLAQNI